MEGFSTERLGVLCFVFHFEGGQTPSAIHCFFVNLVHTVAITSPLSVRQGHKCGVQCAEAIDLTDGDNFVH